MHDAGHAWAYLPDLGETFARLLERDDLPRFARFHFEGHWFERGVEIAERTRAAAGVPDAPIRRMPDSIQPSAHIRSSARTSSSTARLNRRSASSLFEIRRS